MDEIPITYSGIHHLTTTEKEDFEITAKSDAERTSRHIPTIQSFQIHVKTIQKTGGRKYYTIELHAKTGRSIETVSSEDWDMRKAIRQAFTEMKKREEKRKK